MLQIKAIKFGRMPSILRKNSNADDGDIEKRSCPYRRRCFSRSGRRQQKPKLAVIVKTTVRYRRRVRSRAGRRNRAAAQILNGGAGFGHESDTDSQTTWSYEGEDVEGNQPKHFMNRNDNTCLPPKLIIIEGNNNNNSNSNSNSNNNNNNNNNNNFPNPTSLSIEYVESEGDTHLHPSDENSISPQAILPVQITTTTDDDIKRNITTNNNITTDIASSSYVAAAAEESLQQLPIGANHHHEYEIIGCEDIVPPLPTRLPSSALFMQFRVNYLIVYAAIMLADGLQGTHLYALYSGYGYTVANLYSIGFITGAITSPFIGPIVDRFGRKKSAMCYCALEILINITEQYENFTGLILSRMIGGITTNLLSTVFESWLATEHRRRGFDGGDRRGEEPRLALVMRDSTIVSKLAAIASGYIAHYLAGRSGNAGPFGGAVFFTFIALIVVWFLWTENYGNTSGPDASDVEELQEVTTFREHMVGAFQTIVGDTKISRIGMIEGLTEGTLQTFVFLWSPALASFAISAPRTAVGMGENGEPAYGLIFGGFMACGVIGGVVQPYVQKNIFASSVASSMPVQGGICERSADQNTFETGILCALCYLFTAVLLLLPCLVDTQSHYAFSMSLAAFLFYELLVGIYLPCQGVIRSIFMPKESTCSVMTMLRVIVNVAVALGVISTNYVSFTSAFATLSVMMVVAAGLQLSIVPRTKGVSKIP